MSVQVALPGRRSLEQPAVVLGPLGSCRQLIEEAGGGPAGLGLQPPPGQGAHPHQVQPLPLGNLVDQPGGRDQPVGVGEDLDAVAAVGGLLVGQPAQGGLVVAERDAALCRSPGALVRPRAAARRPALK
jgi:hypothetical protein